MDRIWQLQALLALISLTGLTFTPVIAAESGMRLQGMSAEEVEKYFGPPDQRKATASGKETWTYGRSILLFRDSKVSAWSDAGELGKRIKTAKLRSDVAEDKQEQERELWKNPWTPQPAYTDADVLDVVVERSQSIDANSVDAKGPAANPVVPPAASPEAK